MGRVAVRSLWALGVAALAVACGGRDEPRFGFVDGEGGDVSFGGEAGEIGAGDGGIGSRGGARSVGAASGRTSGVGGAAPGGATSSGDVTVTGAGGATSSGVTGVGGVAGTSSSASSGSGGLAGQGGVAGASGSSSSGSGGTGGVGQCVAQAESRCGICACRSCFDELGACIADFGCPVILDCIDRTGCEGLGCYQAATCRGVIDSFGGLLGASMQRAIVLALCTFEADCPC
ncbi:MAG TPA: hypothetical protein VF989_06605 [Polyangiaceae bacterium]